MGVALNVLQLVNNVTLKIMKSGVLPVQNSFSSSMINKKTLNHVFSNVLWVTSKISQCGNALTAKLNSVLIVVSRNQLLAVFAKKAMNLILQ